MTDIPAIAKAKSEASNRYRSKVCSECRYISVGGRCNCIEGRYAEKVFGREACERFEQGNKE